jgi:hypothetical protein
MSTPPHPPQKSLVSDSKTKDRAKQDIGYFRVLGIQKDKSGTGSQPVGFSKYDKMPSPSFNPMNLFSGEKKEVTCYSRCTGIHYCPVLYMY